MTVDEHVRSADQAICANFASLGTQRDLLSQNVLAQLRNLVEGASVRLHLGGDDEYVYAAIGPAMAHVRSKGKFTFLGRFHKLIQISASHYTLDGDTSERLMLKYYEYLIRIRDLLHDECESEVLGNLESFPVGCQHLASGRSTLRRTGSSAMLQLHPDQAAAPGPGSSSASTACICSPQCAQRRSARPVGRAAASGPPAREYPLDRRTDDTLAWTGRTSARSFWTKPPQIASSAGRITRMELLCWGQFSVTGRHARHEQVSHE